MKEVTKNFITAMTTSQPNLPELAKQGDVRAISTLLNRHLKPIGATAKVGLKETCLQIFLESIQVPEQQTLMTLTERGIISLGLHSITSVKVYAKKMGDELPSWAEEFRLEESSISEFEPSSEESDYSRVQQTQTASVNSSKTVVYRKTNSADAGDKVQEAVKDAVEGLKIFITNPVGGLPMFYESLGKQRSLAVGVAFAIFYVICVLLSVNKAFGSFIKYTDINFFNLSVLGAVQFISFVSASAVTRKIFRGFGSLEGDVFVAGISLLAPSFLLLISSLVGVLNIEIILIVLILSATYMILTLYTGCHKISKISEQMSPLAVVVMLLLSAWMSKIIISAAVNSNLPSSL